MISENAILLFATPLLGGALIGLAVSLFLFLNGRVAGISGILGGLLKYTKNDFAWRLFFIAGLIGGGVLLQLIVPSVFETFLVRSSGQMALAGVLVGVGTLMGSGCTSGHGVCGMSRLSPRSFVATLVFMAMGILTVWMIRHAI